MIDVEMTRKLVAALIPNLEWRLHGLGVLQAYIQEDLNGDGEEWRLHIWHPSLVTVATRPHNHRFDLTSWVLHGAMRHTHWKLTEDPKGDWFKYEIINARKQSMSQDDAAIADDKAYRVLQEPHLIRFGESYTFAKGEFHDSATDDLCVTIIKKQNQMGFAQILGPKDGIAHAFMHGKTRKDWQPVLDQAIEALRANSQDTLLTYSNQQN